MQAGTRGVLAVRLAYIGISMPLHRQRTPVQVAMCHVSTTCNPADCSVTLADEQHIEYDWLLPPQATLPGNFITRRLTHFICRRAGDAGRRAAHRVRLAGAGTGSGDQHLWHPGREAAGDSFLHLRRRCQGRK